MSENTKINKTAIIKDALNAVRRAKERLKDESYRKVEPIAIVGMGCRFPGGITDPDSYWEFLKKGESGISEVPVSRWNINALYDSNPDTPGKISSRWGGFLKDVDEFDPDFFGISHREALAMDPQQRLLLAVTWEALENAGILPENLMGTKTGVFIGIALSDYSFRKVNDLDKINAYFGTGSFLSVAAGRISYTFGLEGPAVSVDTACSSSLVAIHQAVQSLRNGESELALAGGSNLILTPQWSVTFSRARMMASDGQCKTFDASANGYARGEGVGVIVLKRLSDALRDGNKIEALVRGSAVNHDGRSSGLTVPRGPSQQNVIQSALASGGLRPEDVSYVEAHGTGTPLGDPIEVGALAEVFGENRGAENPLRLGSVKTNFGHTEGAAGVAGILKLILSLKHKQIPPILNFKKINPKISLDTIPAQVVTELTPWQAPGTRVGGVSSFGISGTNSHIVLEEYEPATYEGDQKSQIPPKGERYLLPLSAKSPEALENLTSAWITKIQSDSFDYENIYQYCYNAALRRTHHGYRLSSAFTTEQELLEGLKAFAKKDLIPGGTFATNPELDTPTSAFLFGGQGSQWIGMGQGLLKSEAIFRETLERIDELLKVYTGWSLIDEINASPEKSRMGETEVAQPAIFGIQMGLAALWSSRGIFARATLGHSIGELAAACVAGIYSLEDGVKIVYHRSRLMQAATGRGKMAAVELSEEALTDKLKQSNTDLDIAAVNSLDSCVVSGEGAALESFIEGLKGEGVRCKILGVNYAFHSRQMDDYLAELKKSLAGIEANEPEIKFISAVTGDEISASEMGADYWVNNVRQSVRFAAGLSTLLKEDFNVFIEISPHPVLRTYVESMLGNVDFPGLVIGSLKRDTAESQSLMAAMGAVYSAGFNLDWEKIYPVPVSNISIPTYQWERKSFWIEGYGGTESAVSAPGGSFGSFFELEEREHPLLGYHLDSPVADRVYLNTFSAEKQTFLLDHVVYGLDVLPGSAYISAMISACQNSYGTDRCQVENFKFSRVLSLTEGDSRRVQTILMKPSDGSPGSIEIFSKGTGESQWLEHATCLLPRNQENLVLDNPEVLDIEAIQKRCQQYYSQEDIYDNGFNQLGSIIFNFGDSFKWLKRAWRRNGESLAEFETPATISNADSFSLHPGLLDSFFQTMGLCFPVDRGVFGLFENGNVYVPSSLKSFKLHRKPSFSRFWCHAVVDEYDTEYTEYFSCNCKFYSDSGEIIAEMDGLRMSKISPTAVLAHASAKQMSGKKDIYFDTAWRKTTLSLKQNTASEVEKINWIIFSDNKGQGEALGQRLEEQGGKFHIVLPGEKYNREKNRVSVNPLQDSDFESLFKDCLDQNGQNRILYLWGLNDDSDRNVFFALESCMRLNKALLKQKDLNAKFSLITQNSRHVIEGDNLDGLRNSTLWGFGASLFLENPETGCLCIDLDEIGTENLLTAIIDEVIAAETEQVAFRNETRYVSLLTYHRFLSNHNDTISEPEESGERETTRRSIQAEASYIITGGMGALGQLVAKWLIDKGARNLVLLSRSGGSSEAKEAIRSLSEQAGVTITTPAVDIASYDALKDVIESVQKSDKPLRGIFHCAGSLDDGMLSQQTWERFENVLAPKVTGSWNLHSLTENIPLDYFVCFSSITSVIGSRGQTNYSAANSYLDALSHYRHAKGLPALSVNWGPWGDVGMATADKKIERLYVSRGLKMITPEVGLGAMERLIVGNITQAGIWGYDPLKFAEANGEIKLLEDFNRVAVFIAGRSGGKGQQQSNSIIDELKKVAPEKVEGEFLKYIVAQLATVLGVPQEKLMSKSKLGFREMGMDSLISVEFRNRLQKGLSRKLPVSLTFDYPDIRSLSEHLLQGIQKELEEKTEERTPEPVLAPSAPVTVIASDKKRDEDIENMDNDELADLLNAEVADLLSAN